MFKTSTTMTNRIAELEAKLSESEALLAKAVKLLKIFKNPAMARYVHIDEVGGDERTTFADLKEKQNDPNFTRNPRP